MRMYPVMSLAARTEERSRSSIRPLGSPPKSWGRPPSPGAAAWRVRASVTLPVGTIVGPYPSDILLGTNTADHPKGAKYLEVKVKDNTIVACPEVDAPRHWLLHVTPARDRHEQNMEAMRDSRGLISFRVIKTIDRGDELLVWYSAELALECNIPILSPANIRSDQEYMCTNCDSIFRYPNTLKAHCRFHCTRSSMTSFLGQYATLQSGNILSAYQHELSRYVSQLGTLWNLRKIASSEHGMPKMAAISPQLSPRTATSESKSAFRACSSSAGKTTSVSPIFSPTQSPLMPRRKLGDKSSSDNITAHKKDHTDVRRHSNTSPMMPYPPMTSLPNYLDKVYMYNYAHYLRSDVSVFPGDMTGSFQRHPFVPGPDFSAATQRDASLLARNIPTSGLGFLGSRHEENKSPGSDRDSPPKVAMPPISFPMPSETAGEPIDLLPKSLYMSKAYKGHLCIYCGKVYSRKYGLKIHLRTHTGYKPLKCKVCLRPFGDPSNLNKHIRLHAEGETPYRCEYCGKVLVRRRDLERHIKSRHTHLHQDVMIPTTDGEENSDTFGDTDTSFIDVDEVDEEDDVEPCDLPLDMSRQEIDVA